MDLHDFWGVGEEGVFCEVVARPVFQFKTSFEPHQWDGTKLLYEVKVFGKSTYSSTMVHRCQLLKSCVRRCGFVV